MAELDGNIHIGTSGWSYDHWKGPFYPEDLPGSEMLSHYAGEFNTLEINGTFYRLPEENTVNDWRETVPDRFVFSVKASRYITHMKKLNDPVQSTRKFFDRVKILENKLGPVLFQLPPRWHKNRKRLERFMKALPEGYRYTFEFRDPSWFEDDVIDLLKENNAAFCIYDLAGRVSPFHTTADFVYIRLHGPGEKYRGNYSEDLLEKWVDKFKQWRAENREIFCYFDNDYEARAPRNAKTLINMLKLPV